MKEFEVFMKGLRHCQQSLQLFEVRFPLLSK